MVERRVGRQIAARHGCPRIRFELVASPCAHALPPRINESAERLAPQASTSLRHARKKTITFPALQPASRCDFGEASGRGLRRAEKSNLHVAKGRAPSTSQDQSKRTGVCTVTTIHVSRGKHTVALRGAGGVDTRHEVEISMEEWGSSVYSLG